MKAEAKAEDKTDETEDDKDDGGDAVADKELESLDEQVTVEGIVTLEEGIIKSLKSTLLDTKDGSSTKNELAKSSSSTFR